MNTDFNTWKPAQSLNAEQCREEIARLNREEDEIRATGRAGAFLTELTRITDSRDRFKTRLRALGE